MIELPKVLCVDFDDTLFTSKYFPEVKHQTWMNKIVTRYVKYKKKQGWVIIINTLREKGKGKEQAIKALCMNNIPYDYINENEPNAVNYWGESRKIACTLNIDDRNVGLIGWLLRRFG
jgi:hypothetical protein